MGKEKQEMRMEVAFFYLAVTKMWRFFEAEEEKQQDGPSEAVIREYLHHFKQQRQRKMYNMDALSLPFR